MDCGRERQGVQTSQVPSRDRGAHTTSPCFNRRLGDSAMSGDIPTLTILPRGPKSPGSDAVMLRFENSTLTERALA